MVQRGHTGGWPQQALDRQSLVSLLESRRVDMGEGAVYLFDDRRARRNGQGGERVIEWVRGGVEPVSADRGRM